MESQVLTREAAESALRAMGERENDEFEIGEAALLLAALDRPVVPLDRYRGILADHAARIAAQIADSSDADAVAQALRTVLHAELGFDGDRETYDDPQNANLIRVIDRRRGLPVALGILYLDASHRLGLRMEGLAFPWHFLVRLQVGGRRLVLDPYNGGRAVEPPDMRDLLARMSGGNATLLPEHHVGVGPRQVLLRLQNNIKLRAQKAGDLGRAAAVVRSMALISPGETGLWFESGELEAKNGNLSAAIAAFERALAIETEPRLRMRVADALQALRRQLN